MNPVLSTETSGEPTAPSDRRTWVASLLRDRTLERTAMLHQLLFGLAVLVISFVVALGTFPGSVPLYFVAAVIVFIVTAATLVIPWNSIAPVWLVIVPVIDVLAIGVMRVAGPNSGIGLLWIFPVIWLASGFGLVGYIGGVVGCTGMFLGLAGQSPTTITVYSALLLPIVLIAVGTTSYFTARRAAAQRVLLDRQADLLVRALARTRRQEQEVTQVLDAVDFGVIRFASDGEAAVVNEAHAKLQQALGRGGGDAQLPVFREDGQTPMPDDDLPLSRAARGESFDSQLVWFGDPQGERHALRVSARRVTTAEGIDDGAVVVSRDVTAEMTALRARDDLVASVSHELRTPLTAILGYLDLAVDDERVPQRVRDNLQVAMRNAERLLEIVADILAASSSSREGAELPVRPEEVNVAEVVAASGESLLPRAAERSIDIDSSQLEPAVAHVDPLRIRQVVDNLIANAITYNNEGGSISLGTTTDGRSAWILVRDTGLGMSEKDRAGLFQRYFRGAARATATPGTGLGLAISRDIVRAHGGDITVRSAPGQGSTFIVRLPVKAPQRGVDA